MILEGCPGAARLKTPTLEEKICPVCGNIIEIFSVDTEVACERRVWHWPAPGASL